LTPLFARVVYERENEMHHKPNRWKGFVTGMLGGAVGVIAMDYYWQTVAPVLDRLSKERGIGATTEAYPESLNLDSLAIAGEQYQVEESSTATLGRILYQWITGKEPESEETKTVLSYLVHWVYGILQGGIYGALTSSEDDGLDILGGPAYAAGLWLFGDELVVPVLGLQSGPTAVPPVQHANRLGAHLAYGLATGIATGLLRRLL